MVDPLGRDLTLKHFVMYSILEARTDRQTNRLVLKQGQETGPKINFDYLRF